MKLGNLLALLIMVMSCRSTILNKDSTMDMDTYKIVVSGISENSAFWNIINLIKTMSQKVPELKLHIIDCDKTIDKIVGYNNKNKKLLGITIDQNTTVLEIYNKIKHFIGQILKNRSNGTFLLQKLESANTLHKISYVCFALSKSTSDSKNKAIWKDFVQAIPKTVSTSYVDCKKYPKLCKISNISIHPTVKIYQNNSTYSLVGDLNSKQLFQSLKTILEKLPNIDLEILEYHIRSRNFFFFILSS